MGTSSSQMVTVAIPGPIFSPVGAAMAFVPYPANRAGAPAEGSLLSPSAAEVAVRGGGRRAEGAIIGGGGSGSLLSAGGAVGVAVL